MAGRRIGEVYESPLTDLDHVSSVLAGMLSAFPEKTVGGNYIDFTVNRDEVARCGLHIDDLQEVILSAVEGMNITRTVDGLDRYPVNLRCQLELCDNIPALERTLVATPTGAQVPLTQLADVQILGVPPLIKTGNTRKTAWVYVGPTTSDVGGWWTHAKQLAADKIALPAGYGLIWSGQYEYIQAADKRLAVAVPGVLVIIVMLLYLSHRNWFNTCVVLLAVPFSLIGAVWFMHLADYNMSLAVWAGLIALAAPMFAGLRTSFVMELLIYLVIFLVAKQSTVSRLRGRSVKAVHGS